MDAVYRKQKNPLSDVRRGDFSLYDPFDSHLYSPCSSVSRDRGFAARPFIPTPFAA